MAAVKVVKCVPAIAVAVLTGALLLRQSGEAMQILGNGCPSSAPNSWRSHVPLFDNFLCLMVNFFMNSVQSDEGKVVTGYICTLLVSVLTFMAVEGSRLKSGLAVSATWFHGIVLAVTGVSVSFPLLWLPAYFLTDGGNREQDRLWKKKISLFRVGAIAVTFLFLWFDVLALFFPLTRGDKQIACLLFNIMPFAVTLAYVPFSTSQDAPQQKGHEGVIALHLLQAGFGLTWHLVALLFMYRDPELGERILNLFTSFETAEWPVYFLLIDVVSLFVSFLYLTALEDGLVVAALELLGGVVFGPAFAVSAYCVFREQHISKSVSKTKTKAKEN